MPADVSITALAERLRGLARLAAGGGRVRRRRRVGAGDGAVLRLAGAVAHAARPGVADRRRGQRRTSGIAQRWYRRPEIAAAAVGWWFGFGYFLAGLFWVGEAFLVEAEIFAVLLPFAVTLLPGGLALFYAAAAGIAARLLARRRRAACWRWRWRCRPRNGCAAMSDRLSLERAGLRADLPAAADAERGRARHLRADAVAVLIFALPPVLWAEAPAGIAGRRMQGCRAGRRSRAARRCRPARPGAPGARRRRRRVPGVKIRIVQPSVPQREKWRPENQRRIFLDHLELSASQRRGRASTISPASRT